MHERFAAETVAVFERALRVLPQCLLIVFPFADYLEVCAHALSPVVLFNLSFLVVDLAATRHEVASQGRL